MTDFRRFSSTRLWQTTLAHQADDQDRTPREWLRASYETFRRNANSLVEQIARDLPGLTLHDVNHLDALWSATDLLIGDKIKLTPLETFVLGGAILIHDAGHAIAAHPGGLAGILRSNEWRDAAYLELQRAGVENVTPELLSNLPVELHGRISLSVLRNLHANRAEELLQFEIGVHRPEMKQYLLEDKVLNRHLGPLIGLIAASHNWPIDLLQTRLPEHFGAIQGLPSTWTIDPIKLACILRCADAMQIDQERAPDFAFAMLTDREISEKHWKAQNKLTQAALSRSDAQAIIFASSFPYTQDESDAWWIAYDLIQIVNSELRLCNALLRDTNRQSLAIDRVIDADTPARLSRHVKTKGWQPADARIRVSDVNRVVHLLGGAALYGDNPLVPLRELIQNAADAVRARQMYDRSTKRFRGRVTVRLSTSVENETPRTVLTVEDNGIGMSERVLTGPLIDFGASLWSMAQLDDEFPGLRSTGVKQAGRYGIGFFSTFMISNCVEVSSRQFHKGLDSAKTLLFKDGITLRPILTDCGSDQLTLEVSTSVRLHLNESAREKLLHAVPRTKKASTEEGFTALLRYLCPSLDVDVYCQVDSRAEQCAHSAAWRAIPAKRWLQSIADPTEAATEMEAVLLERSAKLLRPIESDGQVFGRAALVSAHRHSRGMSVLTFGGFRSRNFGDARPYGGNNEGAHIGVMFGKPSNAARSEGIFTAPANVLKKWAEDQLNIAESLKLETGELGTLAWAATYFGAEIGRVAFASQYVLDGSVPNDHYISLSDLTNYVLKTKAYFLCDGGSVVQVPLIKTPKFVDRLFAIPSGPYEWHLVPLDYDPDNSEIPWRHCFIGNLLLALNERGYEGIIETEDELKQQGVARYQRIYKLLSISAVKRSRS